ncbi:WHG domain-containing protein [Paenibacillus chartarius]|uniref:WHG domain-containing protein n=1 Tax=Paenibacillus chartarius TaxID=747481 RepID=A0ABV6DG79_9BACL
MVPRAGLDQTTVLNAAAELADAHGFDQVTLALLAQKLGVRTPSLYNHIDGLPGLKRKLSAYGLQQLYDRLLLSAAGLSGDDAVRAFAHAYLSFARSRPGLYELTLRAAEPDETEFARVGGEIVELIVRILGAYQLQEDAAIHAVRGLRSILHGFASLERIGGFRMPVGLDESFRVLLDTFLAGLRAIKSNEGGPA